MVVYNSLCADLSKEFLEFIPGSIEEKLLTLQEQLGEHFPEIVLQYLCGDEQNIVQIKGSWRDVQNIHEVLEAWMNSGQKEEPEESNFAEKIEGISDGVFFDLSKQHNHAETQKDVHADSPSDNKDLAVTAEPEIFDEDTEDEDNAGELPKTQKLEKLEDITSLDTDFANESIKKHSEPTSNISTPKQKSGITFSRSGRKIKKTFISSDEEDCDLESGYGLPNISKIEDFDASSDLVKCEENISNNDDDIQESGDIQESVYDSVKVKGTFVAKNDKRGRKKKKLDRIENLEVEHYLNISVEKSLNEENIKCTLCNFTTNARRHLKAHLLRCHTEAGHTCKFCKKKYALEKDLRAHTRTHFPQYRCKLCARRFPTKSLMDLHLQRFHSEAKEVKRQKRLNGPSVFKCDQCDYTTGVQKNLKDHIGRNHQEKIYECEICKKAFGLQKDLVSHSKSHTDKYTCEVCGRSLASRHALKNHINVIHKGIKNTYSKTYVCDHCGELCRNKTHYSEHMNREHLNVKPFGCPLCTMSFYTNASLKAHLQTHSDERKHMCPTCGKGFKAAASMKVHQLTHLEQGQRPHACTTCSKAFSQKGALIRHMRIHSGEKPYKCRLCESAFSDYSILRRHMLGVHKINSRDLCKLNDSMENRGGPKPERLKVEDIKKFRHIIREPSENDSEPKQLTSTELAIFKANTSRVDEMKLEQNIQIQLAPENKLAFTSMETSGIDPSAQVRYIIHDGSAVRTEAVENGLLVGDLNPNEISVSRPSDFSIPSVMQHGNEDVNDEVVNGLSYSDMPFTVQRYISGDDGQNISIQILHPQETV